MLLQRRSIDNGDRKMIRRQFLKISSGALLFVRAASVGKAHTADEQTDASQRYAESPTITSASGIDSLPTLFVQQGGSIDLSAYFAHTDGDKVFSLASYSAPLPAGVTLGAGGTLSAVAGAISGMAVDVVVVMRTSCENLAVADHR
jgi:hypothetical protein